MRIFAKSYIRVGGPHHALLVLFEINLYYIKIYLIIGAEYLPAHRRGNVDSSLRIVVDSWKKEKKDLVQALEKASSLAETSQKDSERLRVQYKKVKEQLEHSNSAFTLMLKNNLSATKKMEEELKTSLEEKQKLLQKCDEGKKVSRNMENLQQEMEDLKITQEEVRISDLLSSPHTHVPCADIEYHLSPYVLPMAYRGHQESM